MDRCHSSWGYRIPASTNVFFEYIGLSHWRSSVWEELLTRLFIRTFTQNYIPLAFDITFDLCPMVFCYTLLWLTDSILTILFQTNGQLKVYRQRVHYSLPSVPSWIIYFEVIYDSLRKQHQFLLSPIFVTEGSTLHRTLPESWSAFVNP